MAVVPFAYDHARDPMNPTHLGLLVANALGLSTQPAVDINPTQIVITHPNISETNRAAIQSVINGYVFDVTLTTGVQGSLQQKAQAALAQNATYLAGPQNQTTAVTQVAALTRQVNALVRLLLQQFDSTAGT